ncbi:hypothetical protein ROHU_016970 [Labeo rohita]|uniref:Uncharacterized protein n=1 Tax=Labeo rohita TaxID=84645 RepID=A0A498NI30_LABRO|nr:hypothetical protein ROHU_016970 [Labeo rohita]
MLHLNQAKLKHSKNQSQEKHFPVSPAILKLVSGDRADMAVCSSFITHFIACQLAIIASEECGTAISQSATAIEKERCYFLALLGGSCAGLVLDPGGRSLQ